MRATVRLRLPDGADVLLGPGDLIGRMDAATLVLDDPRVSEAHAIVSLRQGELHLLSLRRLIAVGGKPVSEVRLEPGLTIELAEGLALVVDSVHRPARVLALRSEGLGTRPLSQVSSVFPGRPPRLVGRFDPKAPVHIWSVGDRWRLRQGDEHEVGAGFAFQLDGQAFELVELELAQAGQSPTRVDGGVRRPLRIEAAFDTVHIHREGRAVTRIGGKPARIVSELVAFDGPVAWEVLARELWSDDADVNEVRHRFDVTLGRLRAKLRAAGVRPDLVSSDGAGSVQLVLYPEDVVEDRT